MARRTLEERHIRKLTRTGRGKSVSVTIPIEFIRELKWRDRQKVVVTRYGKGVRIVDWPVSRRGAKASRGGKK